MRVVLIEPEIPQNTGSIARLCAATQTPLDLVGELGFSLEDRYLRRAGLDYWPHVDLHRHADWLAYSSHCQRARPLGFSARGTDSYTRIRFREDDLLVFGGESKGLPGSLREELAPLHRIPIAGAAVRSLNLANAVSIVLYEALRQLGRV